MNEYDESWNDDYYCEADELGYECMYPECDCDMYIIEMHMDEMEEFDDGDLPPPE